MDRLEKLAKEKEGYVGNMSPVLPTNFVIPEHYQEFIEYENTILNWLDGQIRQSVAQEIIRDYENAFEPTVPMSITYEKHHAIKSKWGIEC